MRENKFRRWIKQEIETEAAALEKHAEENEELSSLRMPEDSYADLMQRIQAREKEAKEAGKNGSVSAETKVFRIRRRTLIAAALAAVLLIGTGVGVAGERLFAPEVIDGIEDGEYNVRVETGEETIYLNLDETEAYEEIEERLGILALRLGYKPQGMELRTIYIDENMGEAQMEFDYNNDYFIIYVNKQRSNAAFDMQVDGIVVDTISTYYCEKNITIFEIDKDETQVFYAAQFEQGNAYYYFMSNLSLDGLKQILEEIFFINV